MNDRNHHIGTFRFQLSVGSSEVSDLQRNISRWIREELIRALEGMLDQLYPEKEVIYLDRLEIDLGIINSADLMRPESLYLILARIREKLPPATIPVPGSTILDHQENLFSHWLYFLKHGRFSWNMSQPPFDWTSKILESLILDSGNIKRLQHLVREQPSVIDRLIAQFSSEFLCRLLTIFNGHAFSPERWQLVSEEFQAMIRQVRSWDIPENGRMTDAWTTLEHWTTFFLEYSLIRALRENERHTFEELLERSLVISIRSFLLKMPMTGRKPLVDRLISLAAAFDHFGLLLNKKKDELTLDLPVKTDYFKEGVLDLDGVGTTEIPFVSETNAEQHEVRFVELAGMVLCHPFLPRLFSNLQLIRDDVFISEAHRCKAVHLLFYLATKETAPFEYQLTLPRLLVNLPDYIPIPRQVFLNPDELDECDAVLDSLIGHWAVLKTTSHQGLRESFFQRDGKLEKTELGWELTVEQRAFDMLLDRLPWTIGFIRLPWMKEILRVTWR